MVPSSLKTALTLEATGGSWVIGIGTVPGSDAGIVVAISADAQAVNWAAAPRAQAKPCGRGPSTPFVPGLRGRAGLSKAIRWRRRNSSANTPACACEVQLVEQESRGR